MAKYIVDGPVPNYGEKLSSGGVRKNDGKMVEQFKNPIPYNENNVDRVQVFYVNRQKKYHPFEEEHPELAKIIQECSDLCYEVLIKPRIKRFMSDIVYKVSEFVNDDLIHQEIKATKLLGKEKVENKKKKTDLKIIEFSKAV